MERISRYTEIWFRVLYIGYFSKSICKPAKFSHKLFCSRGKKLPARDHSVFVSCWAIFYSSLEQVLGGTYIYAYGISSGFFVQTMPHAWNVIPSEARMSVRPVNHYMSSLAGNLLTRQMARALDQHSLFLSRNEKSDLHSGIFVFKYPRIIDKWNN